MIVNFFLEILTIMFIVFSFVSISYASVDSDAPNTTASTAKPVQPPKPTVSPPNPTPTAPNPNFQYLPQKAFVYSFAPENGVPTVAPLQPLTSTPTVVAPQTVSPVATAPAPAPNILDQFGGVTGIVAMLGAAGVYIKTKFLDKTVKANAAMIVKGADVDQSIAKQVYENMPDKGESIHDKPEIRLEELNKNKEQATETASKA